MTEQREVDVDAGDPPSIWIQWKGTGLCADFRCACGAEGHIDEYFAYSIRCGACGQVWLLPRAVGLVKIEDATEGDQKWHGPDDAKDVRMDDDE